MDVKDRELLIKQLKRQEQSNRCALKPYRCPKGKLTIGWGHNMDANALKGYLAWYYERHREITEDMADYLLDHDVNLAEMDAATIPNFFKLSSVRQAVVVNMVFNMGIYTLKKFKNFLRAIYDQDVTRMVAEMKNSIWYGQLGGDPPGTDDGRLERPEELIKMMEDGEWMTGI